MCKIGGLSCIECNIPCDKRLDEILLDGPTIEDVGETLGVTSSERATVYALRYGVDNLVARIAKGSYRRRVRI